MVRRILSPDLRLIWGGLIAGQNFRGEVMRGALQVSTIAGPRFDAV